MVEETVKRMFYSKDSGQTILEVLIALTLVVIFLSGVVVVELYAIRNLEYAQHKSLATKLARQQFERARVVRDTAGIDGLSVCLSSCYINSQLTPVPLTPTGIYGQSLTLLSASSSECPLPDVATTPAPVSYKATAGVYWGQGTVVVTPASQIELFTCLTDWR